MAENKEQFLELTQWSRFDGKAGDPVRVACSDVAAVLSRAWSSTYGGSSRGATICLRSGKEIDVAEAYETVNRMMGVIG